MPDTYIDDVFDEAEGIYPLISNYTRAIQIAYALVLGVRDIRVRVAEGTDYKANESEEKLSQKNSPWAKLEADFQKDLDELVDGVKNALPPVMFGRGRRKPSHYVELPDRGWVNTDAEL